MNSDSKSSTFPTSSTTAGSGLSSGGSGSSMSGSGSSGLSGSSMSGSSSGSGMSGSSSGSGMSGSSSGSGMSGSSSGSGMSGSSGGGTSGGMNSDGTVRRVAQAAHQAVDKLEQTLGSSGTKVMSMQEEYGEMARDQVKANPLAAVGVAFAVGIVFSKLFMR